MRWIMILFLTATLARAEGEEAGVFDYYILSLTWSPSFCAAAGEHPQCGRGLGWVLHGLWPQYERGWPSFCRSIRRNPSRGDTAAMADIMGSSGSAWHQWKKHGRCSGLSSADYYALARLAYERIVRPDVFRKLDRPVKLPVRVVEEAFLKANPGLEPDGITVTCKDGRVYEARICLTRELEPRRCGDDVRRDCRMPDALLSPVN